MDKASTPINELNNYSTENNIENTVDDIINQINGNNIEYDNEDLQYNGSKETAILDVNQKQQGQQQVQQQVQQVPQQNTEFIDTSKFNSNISSISDILISNLKEPLIVIILYILLNLKHVDNIFKFKNIGLLVSDNGELTFTSIIIKSVLLGLIFYLIKMLV